MTLTPISGGQDSTILSYLEQAFSKFVIVSNELAGTAVRVIRSIHKTFREARKHYREKGWPASAVYVLTAISGWCLVTWHAQPQFPG
jgi:hypothetical protein